MMKKLVVLILCIVGMSAHAFKVVDDFEDGDISDWTSTEILTYNGTANIASWSSSGGVLSLNTTTKNCDAQQYAMIKSGLALAVGDEIQMILDHSLASQDLGLYVGGTAPQTGVRQDYIAMYARNSGEVFSRGFDGTTEYGQVGWVSPAYEKLFIARTDTNTYEAGYYEGGVRNILTTRTPVTANDADVVGIYADVRAEGTLGNVDSIMIWNDLYAAHEPSPEDAEPTAGTAQGDGTTDVDLSWEAGIDPNGLTVVNPKIKKHYVFMSTSQSVALPDPNLYYIGEVAHVDYGTTLVDTFSTVTGLDEGSDYLWKVEEGLDDGQGGVYGPNDPNNIDGPVWSFKTANSLPEIDESGQPVSAIIVEGTATYEAFTITVSSATEPSYQWFYSADDQIDDPGDSQIGTNEPNLAIANVVTGDEGYYYCRVANDATVSGGGSEPDVYSDVVTLVVGRLVGEYLFDTDTLADTSGNGNDGQGKSVSGLAEPNALLAADVTLSFEAGVNGTGKAVVLDADEYVDFGTTAYPKAGSLAAGIGAGLDAGTITCWVKPAQTGLVLGTYNDGLTTGFAFSLTPNGDTTDTRIQLRGEAADVGTLQGRLTAKPGWDLFDGAWHLIAATWTAGDTVTVYVDGEAVASVAAGTPALYAVWQRAVLLGASRQYDNRDLLADLYGGSVDDLKIYNYARSANEIANEYYTQTGDMACLDHNFDGSSFNVDNADASYCKVDLADFAEFAAKWLTNGLGTGL